MTRRPIVKAPPKSGRERFGLPARKDNGHLSDKDKAALKKMANDSLNLSHVAQGRSRI